jgi:hypothetical protein
MVLPVSVATVGFASMAAAATGITCTGMTGNFNKPNGSLTGCSDTANTGGKATLPIKALASGSGTITWNKTGTTSIDKVVPTTVAANKCSDPSANSEIKATAVIVKSTGAAAKSIKKGWIFTAYVCVNGTTDAITILKGTKVVIGPKS